MRWIVWSLVMVSLYVSILAFPPGSPSLGTLSANQAIRKVFGSNASLATCIAWHESRLNVRAVSPTGDYGLFQINRQAHESWVDFTPRKIFDPLYNSRIAYRLSRKGTNWRPWAVHARCGV